MSHKKKWLTIWLVLGWWTKVDAQISAASIQLTDHAQFQSCRAPNCTLSGTLFTPFILREVRHVSATHAELWYYGTSTHLVIRYNPVTNEIVLFASTCVPFTPSYDLSQTCTNCMVAVCSDGWVWAMTWLAPANVQCTTYACLDAQVTLAPTSPPTTRAPTQQTTSTTRAPTRIPTTIAPTRPPTLSLTTLRAPTTKPTTEPTSLAPTAAPTLAPSSTTAPTSVPTFVPTATPTVLPTSVPSAAPTASPTSEPTTVPTESPTKPGETRVPTTAAPTARPTARPTTTPTTSFPTTQSPTSEPTATTTILPDNNNSSSSAAEAGVPVYIVILIAAIVLVCTVLAIVLYRRKAGDNIIIKEREGWNPNHLQPNYDRSSQYDWEASTRTIPEEGEVPQYAVPQDEPMYADQLPFGSIRQAGSFSTTRSRPATVAEYDLAAGSAPGPPANEPAYALASPAPSTTFNPMYTTGAGAGAGADVKADDGDDGDDDAEPTADPYLHVGAEIEEEEDGDDDQPPPRPPVRRPVTQQADDVSRHVYLTPRPANDEEVAYHESTQRRNSAAAAEDEECVYTMADGSTAGAAAAAASPRDDDEDEPVLYSAVKQHAEPMYALALPDADGYNPDAHGSHYDNAAA